MPRSPKRPSRQSPRNSSGRRAKIASASENVGGEIEPAGEEVDAEVEVADTNNGDGESQPTTTDTTTKNVAIAWCKADLTAANERLKAAREEFEKDYNQLVDELRQEERALDDRLEELNKKIQDAEKIHGSPDASIDDTLEINAGGKIIVVKRSTLTTHTVGTKFGALFSGRWDKKLQRDNHGRIFLDVNSECFQAIVAYLNELMISSEENPPDPPSVDADYEHILWQQLTLFGLWDSVGMPQTVPTGKTPHQQQKLTRGFSDSINHAFDEKRGCIPKVMNKIRTLEASFAEEENFIDNFASGATKDVITLNVSGTIMATKRSTLLSFEESVLAQQFDDSKWTEHGYTNTRVKKWSADDVCNWVNSVEGIQEDVGGIFKENGITGCELLSLNIDGLKLLGIERAGTLCLLQKEIEALVKSSRDVVSLIDHCPYCFGKILDYLRLKQQYDQELARDEEVAPPEVRNSKYKTFEKIVNFYFPGDAAWLILGG